MEAPIGDFYGLGTAEIVPWETPVLTVSHDRAMNCWFPMPYAKHAKITITNEGKQSLGSLYWNIDYRTDTKPLPKDTLYFHAQYRQAQPNHGWTGEWYENGDPIVNYKRNVDGKDNYVWMEAQGLGQFVGVTMSILQNQDGWWGEGDDMFFVDGATTPTFIGTGSEDYFLGSWDFGGAPYSLPMNGAPLVGREIAGSRWSVYRFHLDSPIPFTKSFKVTIEHGQANLVQVRFLLSPTGIRRAVCGISATAGCERPDSSAGVCWRTGKSEGDYSPGSSSKTLNPR